MPEQDAVLAMIVGLQNMQTVLDKVWQNLLPAMHPKTLPADPQGYGALCEKLAALSLPLPNGQPSSPKSNQWPGKTYKLDTNHLKLKSVTIMFNHERSTLSLRDERGEHPIQIGYGAWLKETTNLRGQHNEPIAASGAWTAEDTYEVRLCYYHSFFCPLFRFRYMSRELQIEIEPNVSWTPPAITKITGRVATRQLEAPAEASSPQECDRHRTIARAAPTMIPESSVGP
jgi:hypothetical protein